MSLRLAWSTRAHSRTGSKAKKKPCLKTKQKNKKFRKVTETSSSTNRIITIIALFFYRQRLKMCRKQVSSKDQCSKVLLLVDFCPKARRQKLIWRNRDDRRCHSASVLQRKLYRTGFSLHLAMKSKVILQTPQLQLFK